MLCTFHVPAMLGTVDDDAGALETNINGAQTHNTQPNPKRTLRYQPDAHTSLNRRPAFSVDAPVGCPPSALSHRTEAKATRANKARIPRRPKKGARPTQKTPPSR